MSRSIMGLEMDIISEENENIFSDQHLKQPLSSCQLLIRAHDRIRELQDENQQLRGCVVLKEQQLRKADQASRRERQLEDMVRERDLRIETLERMNEQTVIELAKMEKDIEELKRMRKRDSGMIPYELDSPLNLDRPKKRSIRKDFMPSMHAEMQKQRLHLDENRHPAPQFTFARNTPHGYCSPQATPQRTLKNCFSEVEMNRMITEASNKRQREASRDRLKDYSNYCSSMQRKYSPNTSLKHCHKNSHQQQQRCKSPGYNLYKPVSRPATTGKWRENVSGYSTGLSVEGQWA